MEIKSFFILLMMVYIKDISSSDILFVQRYGKDNDEV